MCARRGLAIGAVVIGFGLLFGGLSADAFAAGSIRPAPRTPDPKMMVLASSDLGGARVTAERYYKDAEFPKSAAPAIWGSAPVLSTSSSRRVFWSSDGIST